MMRPGAGAIMGAMATSKQLCIVLLAAAITSSGCCSLEPHNRRGARTGGLIGAGAGAIIGSMTGSWVYGALIGAGTGALAGYVIADNSQDRRGEVVDSTFDDSHLRDEADREFRIAMEAKDSATAEYHLKRSIQLYPTPAAHNNLGLVQLQNGNREAARASFREAIALEPRYEPALQNLEKIGP
jgi:hypothetical protein